ncbi:MAG: galactokinase family protein [Candidatus Marinimicrobia bacterium]|nr:galactokinase family protein [Candidatus Neomarinimicrobiota bacterium]
MASMTHSQIMRLIEEQHQEQYILDIYGVQSADHPKITRIVDLISSCQFEASHLFSAPGRTELGGNHTDHNLGKVLCAAVREDSLAAVALRSDGQVVINSVGFR